MDREKLNRLRRMAGIEEDYSAQPKKIDESLGVQYTGIGGTTSNPDNHTVHQSPDMKVALKGYEQEEDRYGRHATDVDAGNKTHHSDGDMVHRQLNTMAHNIDRMMKMVDEGDELPAWVAAKITKASDYLDTAADYLHSHMHEGTINEGGVEVLGNELEAFKDFLDRYDIDHESEYAGTRQGAGEYHEVRSSIPQKTLDDLYHEFSQKFHKRAVNEADTSHKFNKGDICKYKGAKVKVVVPDAKANFVGVVPVGHDENKDDVDLVRADKLEMVTEKEMMDKVKNVAKKARKSFMWSDADPEELRQYVRDASDDTLKSLAKQVGEKPFKGSPRDHQTKVIRNELLKRYGQIKAKDMLGEDLAAVFGLERIDNEGGSPMYRKVEEADVTDGFTSFSSWKNTAKKVFKNENEDGALKFTGNEDSAEAVVTYKGKTHTVGKWDGKEGKIMHNNAHYDDMFEGAQYGGKTMKCAALKKKMDAGEIELTDGMTYGDIKTKCKEADGKPVMITVMDHNKDKKIKINVTESAHYHTDDHYSSFADARSHKSAINATSSYENTQDAPDFDEEEEDHEMVNDDTRITVPANVLADLKKVVEDCVETSERAKRRDDDERAHYYEDTAKALQIVHNYLAMKTVEGLKRAQIMVHRMANVSRALIPDHVWKFIVDGGKRRTLKDYHQEVKGMPIVGPRNTLDN